MRESLIKSLFALTICSYFCRPVGAAETRDPTLENVGKAVYSFDLAAVKTAMVMGKLGTSDKSLCAISRTLSMQEISGKREWMKPGLR